MHSFIKVTAILLVVYALIFTAGTLLPEEHSISRSVPLHASQEQVWDAITNYPEMKEWLPGAESFTQLEDSQEGNAIWRFEHKRDRFMEIEQVEKVAPQKLVTRIIKTDAPFKGEWTFELKKVESRKMTVLTITERGTISRPLFRVLYHYIWGYDKNIKLFQSALKDKLEEEHEE